MKLTALYERLSVDDDNPGDSVSIRNQKAMLEEYARQHGYEPFRHFTDDGWSGTNFHRPRFRAMMALVEKGEIERIIVKDLSRFGRDYLRTGFYVDVLFPELDIHFIQQDILHATPEVMKYDLIVSNPPYVCESERAQMERHVLDYEPGLALFVPDDDPLLFYRAIINYASTALMDGGMLAFETNREYATEVGMLMKEGGWSNVEVKRDMFNNERIVIGCLSRKL